MADYPLGTALQNEQERARQESSNNPLNSVPLLSETYIPKTMPSILGTVDMTATFVFSVFFIANAVNAAIGGVSALTYLLLGGITFFVPCVVAVAQLSSMFPNEGSLYNWTYKALGRFWSFFIGLCFWLPGILVIIASADTFVSYLQGLNNQWLTLPWQQGLVIVIILALSGFLATQRFRMIQHMINANVGLLLFTVVLIGLAAVVWLVGGHASATNFSHIADWSVTPENFGLFGVITLIYLGVNVPLNMAGEVKRAGGSAAKRIIRRHLLYGAPIVFVCFFVSTFALLIVRGTAALNSAAVLPYELVTLVTTVFGKIAGGVVVVCILSSLIMFCVLYNYAFARLLLVGAVDQRLPVNVGKLNKNRVPGNAIILQTAITIFFTIAVFIALPFVFPFGNSANLPTEAYNVVLAAVTLVWTFATAFFFVDLFVLYAKSPSNFKSKLVVPIPILWICIIIGPLACIVAIFETLQASSIPSLISNAAWLGFVGVVTLICIVFAAIASMLASSEAGWENLQEREQK